MSANETLFQSSVKHDRTRLALLKTSVAANTTWYGKSGSRDRQRSAAISKTLMPPTTTTTRTFFLFAFFVPEKSAAGSLLDVAAAALRATDSLRSSLLAHSLSMPQRSIVGPGSDRNKLCASLPYLSPPKRSWTNRAISGV